MFEVVGGGMFATTMETPTRSAPALDSRFRGNKDGGVRGWGRQVLTVLEWRTGTGCGVTGDSRIAPTHRVGVSGLRDGWFWWGLPRPVAPLGSCLRRNDVAGVRERRGDLEWERPARRPSGYRLSPVRR